MKKSLMIIASILVCGIAGCASKPQPPPQRFVSPDLVVGRTWGWEGTVTPVEMFDVSAPERYTVHLTVDGAVKVKFDCNSGNGSYRIVNNSFSVGRMEATKQACHDGNLPLASHFVKQLQEAGGYYVADGKLYLELQGNAGAMRFRELKP